MKFDMLTKTLLTIAVAICGALLLLHSEYPAYGQTIGAKVVQYKVVPLPVDCSQQKMQDILDTAGKDGWNLVIKDTVAGDVFANQPVFIFKR
ncbi:MAG TPA: hypothetical protein VGH42_06135 [Verrucomicrobiae bacterium]|jgi:hypothetical protein